MVLLLITRPFSRLVGEEASPPVCSHPLPPCSYVICPFGFVFLYKVYSKQLVLLVKLEDSAPLFSVPLSSDFFRVFLEESPKLLANVLFSLLRDLDCFFHLIFSVVSVLVSGLINHLDACFAALLWDHYSRLGM